MNIRSLTNKHLHKIIRNYILQAINHTNPSISIPKIAVGEAVRRMRTCESHKTKRSVDFRLEVDIWGFPIPQNGATGGRRPLDFGFQPSHVYDLIYYKLTVGLHFCIVWRPEGIKNSIYGALSPQSLKFWGYLLIGGL